MHASKPTAPAPKTSPLVPARTPWQSASDQGRPPGGVNDDAERFGECTLVVCEVGWEWVEEVSGTRTSGHMPLVHWDVRAAFFNDYYDSVEI